MAAATSSANVPQDLAGYRRLAVLYGSMPEIAVFKKFRVAHADNLNLLQAELIEAESDFHEACVFYRIRTEAGDLPPDESVSRLKSVSSGADGPWKLYKKRQKLLKKYDAALLAYRAIEKLPQVNPNTFSALVKWYKSSEGGQYFRRGFEDKVWEDASDLAALSRSDDAVDGVLLKIRDCIISTIFWFFKDKSKRHVLPLWDPLLMSNSIETPLALCPEEKITGILEVTSTALASVLPALSIFALIFIESLLIRISIILMLNLVFIVTMALLGKARRPEVWAVSAAFSAVLVVFVGGTNSPISGTVPP